MKNAPGGLLKSIAGSLAAHVAVIVIGILFLKFEPRTFMTPVYTVDLVAPVARPGTSAVPEAAKEEKKPQGPVEAQRAAAPEKEAPAPRQEKAEKRENAGEKVKVREKKAKAPASVDEALKRIEDDVRRKDESALVDSKIEALRKKRIDEAKRLSERIDELKKEIGSKEEAGARQPRVPPASAPSAAAQGAPPAGYAAGTAAAYPAYYAVIRDRVQEQWIYPEGFRDENVSIIVSIRIARSGKLLDSWIDKSSGNRRFDESLLDAIKKASPFPPLPQEFDGAAFETGFRFCPGCSSK